MNESLYGSISVANLSGRAQVGIVLPEPLEVQTDTAARTTVSLPQRNKYLELEIVGLDPVAEVAKLWTEKLQSIDSRFDGARQLHKMWRVMREVARDTDNAKYAMCIEDKSAHPSFTLISHGLPIHVFGVYDLVNSNVYLAWSTDSEFPAVIRRDNPTQYVFYRYPVLRYKPVFVHTQFMTSKWYKWRRSFTGQDALLRQFNALEHVLFKDPGQAVSRARTVDSQTFELNNGRA